MASFYTVTLTILLIPVVSGHHLTNRVFKWTHNEPVGYTSFGMELASSAFFYTYKKDVKLCAYQCLKSTICKSFNYNQASRQCILNRKDHTEIPITNAGSNDAYYHARDEFSIDPEALGPCAGDVCNGHGRCLETKTPDDQLVPICLCSKGWAGSTCDMADSVPTWGSWHSWDDCSVTCDRGYRLRQRNCEDSSNGQTLNSMECYGRDIEYEACQLQDCPRWDAWASWGQCTTYQTCGRGYKVRHRTCNNGGVPGVDRYCLGPTNETTVCYGMNCKGLVRLRGGTAYGEGRVEIYNDVKKEWGLVCADQWTQQAAELVCKHLGMPGAFQATQDARFGSGDGMYGVTSLTCHGHERTVQMCERNPWSLQPACTGTTEPGGVMCKVNGVWSLWEEWGDCSVTCENGIRQRTRLCNHPPALHGGRDCVGDSLQTKSCTLDMCPVDGVWRTWGDWSSCSMSCGKGTQWRERTCEGPFYNGMDCKGDNKQTQECEVRQCPVDGVWNGWETWGDCTEICGGGLRSRTRTCNGPFYDGAPCPGESNHTEECNQFECPVDGVWREWSEWSACSHRCGTGTQTRNRTCDGPYFGGRDCVGPSMDVLNCNTHSCAVDGVWLPWGEFSECDLSCGGGLHSRRRVCDGPLYGGEDCPGSPEEQEACNLQNCPVDGDWENWTPWESCSLTCGGGLQWRDRTCLGPYWGGRDCIGDPKESRDCNTQNCPEDGYFDQWSQWGDCDVTCGGGLRWRNRTCIGPFYGGADCEGARNESEACNTHNCPVDGVYNDWGDWGECSVTCGGGTKWRQRTCNGPFFGGADCVGPSDDSTTCNEHNCPVDGIWTEWARWSTCTLTCGSGLQWRSRNCIGPFDGGQDCEGPRNTTQACNTHNCPIDGVYGDWSEWGTCDVTCGGGTKDRTRSCIPPKYGGHDCIGPPVDTMACNTHHCPVDGVWFEWGEWGACNTTCGGGYMKRLRTCDAPQYGGADCQGPNEDLQTCSPNPCPIPGDWEAWAAWSPCSVTCGGGKKSRSRVCDMTSHGDLTAPCEGSENEIVDCHTFACRPLARTCSEWGNRGLTASTMADIDPDEDDPTLEPTVVYCNMTAENGVGVTVIGHQAEEEQEVVGYEGAGEYVLEIEYNVTLAHAIAIIDASENCRQFVRWRCKAALIHNPNGEGQITTGWRNRTGGIADYFGDAVPGSGMCTCGMDHSCADDEELACNCDKNDDQWREDSGYLSFKADLPVTEFLAGDTGADDEEGFATVGRITCTGVAS